MRRGFAGVIVAVVLSLGLFGLAACGNSSSSAGSAQASAKAQDPVRVACENGVVLGRSVGGVTSFKGVPFAKPPVGELRWKAPQAPDPSGEEVECYEVW